MAEARRHTSLFARQRGAAEALQLRYEVMQRIEERCGTLRDLKRDEIAYYLALIQDIELLRRLREWVPKAQNCAEVHYTLLRQAEDDEDEDCSTPSQHDNLHTEAMRLIQIGCPALVHLNLSALLDDVTAVVRLFSKADAVFLALMNEDGEPLDIRCAGGTRHVQRFPDGMRPLLRLARQGKRQVFNDMALTFPHRQPPPSHVNLHHLAVIPISAPRGVLGAVFLGRTERPFVEDEFFLVCTFLHQAAVAIENASLHRQSLALAQMQERQRIAADLHDSVVQFLFAAGVEVERMLNHPVEHPEMRLQRVRRLITRATDELRLAISTLASPTNVDAHLLTSIIEEAVRNFEEVSNVPVTIVMSPELPPLRSKVVRAIHRIVREALNNVYKHAEATAVIVSLAVTSSMVRLSIEDNGKGITREAIEASRDNGLHFGIQMMEQIAAQAGGYLELLHSEEGEHGALVRFTVPLEEARK